MNPTPAPPSFDALARELGAGILRFLERYVGNRTVAEDLLQETLLRMHAGLAGFAGRSSVKTWAFAIARRVAADHLRDPRRRAQIVPLEDIDEPADPAPRIEDRIIAGEMNACIRSVVDSLPAAYRAALVLHDLEGLSVDETAAICECSVDAAKIRIHRARGRLRQALAAQCDLYRGGDSVLRCDRKAGDPAPEAG